MKLDAVIFDMDGTITDTEKFYNRTWPLAFAACGYPDFTREDALMQRSLNHADAQKLWGSRYGENFSFETVHQYNTKLVLDLMERRYRDKTGLRPTADLSQRPRDPGGCCHCHQTGSRFGTFKDSRTGKRF